MPIAWMIFGQNGQYVASSNMPGQLLNTLTTSVNSNGWKLIDRVYFAPTSDSYLATDGTSMMYWYQNFPSDLGAASIKVMQAGGIKHVSWAGDGRWGAFDGWNYSLGPNVPAAVGQKLQGYLAANNTDSHSRYVPENLVFAPSGEWLLIGYDQADEGADTEDYSANFPVDVRTHMQTLPDHVGATNVVFNPAGGWIIVGNDGNAYQNNAPPDLMQALQNFQAAGNVLVDISIITLMEPPFPFDVKQPSDGTMEVIANTHGGAVQTTIHLDASGTLNAATHISTSNDMIGWHCCVQAVLGDYTGSVIWTSPIQRFGVDGKTIGTSDSNVPWSCTIPQGSLQSIRSVAISHSYCPNDLGASLIAVGAAISSLGPLVQAIAAIAKAA